MPSRDVELDARAAISDLGGGSPGSGSSGSRSLACCGLGPFECNVFSRVDLFVLLEILRSFEGLFADLKEINEAGEG